MNITLSGSGKLTEYAMPYISVLFLVGQIPFDHAVIILYD